MAEALLWADGESPIRVTVRRKGESDTPLPEGDPQKVSLKIDINELVPGQEWHGLRKLSLENGSESPVREGFAWIAHRLAWEAGIYGHEAAYSGWVRLYINGDLKGVFVNVEQRDARFLRNHGYDKASGTWLYKVDGSTALEVGIGDSPAYHHLCYAPFISGPNGGGGGCAQPDLEVDLPQWVDVRGLFALGAVDARAANVRGQLTQPWIPRPQFNQPGSGFCAAQPHHVRIGYAGDPGRISVWHWRSQRSAPGRAGRHERNHVQSHRWRQ